MAEVAKPDASVQPAAHGRPALLRQAQRENFPVASFLLPKAQRPAVIAFYNFVRTADDIADSPTLATEAKFEALAALEAGLDGAPGTTVAQTLHMIDARFGCGVREARAMLAAFRQDAANAPIADEAGLRAYCQASANPVGHFLLHLHGTHDARAFLASDGLCTALQLLNHHQDVRTDYRDLRRIYLPQTWLDAAGVAPEALAAERASAGVARVLARLHALAGVELAKAAPLCRHISNRRMRAEAGAIRALARALHRRLAGADPLAHDIRLSKPAKLAVGLSGALRGMVAA